MSEAWVAFTFFACQKARSSLIDEENKRGWDKSERNELKQSIIHKEIFNVFEISVCQRQKTFKTINNVKRLIRETFSQTSPYRRKPPDWKTKERKTVWPRSRLHWKIGKIESYFSFDFPLLLTNLSLIQLLLATSWKCLPPKEGNPIHVKCCFRASRYISAHLFFHCFDFLYNCVLFMQKTQKTNKPQRGLFEEVRCTEMFCLCRNKYRRYRVTSNK